MKFIHTADIHWGMIPDSDKPWGKKREQAIRLTFQGIIEDARDSRADLLLISGDLFHRQPLARDLKEVNYLFSTIPGTRVVIIAGNHDRIRKSSALLSFTWAPNVTFLMGEELSSVYFEELNTEVYGFSYHTAEITEAKADNISLPASRRTRILMLHGGDAKHVPFDRNALAASPFSYIALGHIHKPEILLENRMAYAGSPEPLDMTETGPHGYFIGEIDTTSGHVTSLQFKEVCQAQYIPLVVNVTPQTTNTELSQIIADEIRKRGANNIYRFRIRGMRDPDISFDLDFLSGQWNIIEILDESEPQYDFHALFAEHPSDMIGFYIQALVNDIDFTENDSDTGYREELECLAAEKGASCLHDMLKEVDPESAEAIHENNVKRVIRALEFYKKTGTKISEHNEAERQKESPYNFAYYVLNMDRERLYQRIDLRVDLMMKKGLLAEVEKLKEMGCTRDMVSMQGLGYKEILDALDGTISLDEAVYIIKRDTRHFAKRQLTWFKREKEVTWVDQGNFDFDREKILMWMLEDLRERSIMAVRKKEKSWNL